MKSLLIFYCVPLIFFYSCGSETIQNWQIKENEKRNYEEIKDKQNVSDTCYIQITKTKKDTVYDCSQLYFYFEKNTIIKEINNEDYGFEITPLLTVQDDHYFILYAISTGRQKLVKFQNAMIFESAWFDDDASGDNVNLKSLEDDSTFFLVEDSFTNEKYRVKWHVE